MSSFRKINRSGFTIIELLIVIVVIGVLATIALNAVSDIQRRARNARVIDLTVAYEKALIAHSVDNGNYVTDEHECLGKNYTNVVGGAPGECYWDTSLSVGLTEDASYINALEPYFGNTDVDNSAQFAVLHGSWIYNGPTVQRHATLLLDGQTGRHFILYVLEGYQVDCHKQSVGGAWPNLTTANSNSWYYSHPTHESTMCIYPLPEL